MNTGAIRHRIVLCFMAVATITQGISAQTAAEEFAAMAKVYEEASSLSFRMHYRLYHSSTATEPVEEMRGSVKKTSHCLYQKMGPMETVESQDHFFKIDHDQREMIVLARKTDQALVQALPVAGMDSLLALVDNVQRESTGPREAKYTLSGLPGNSAVVSYELFFDTEHYRINRLVLYFRSGNGWIETEAEAIPRLEITYTGYDLRTPVSCETLDYPNYMTFQDGSWMPLPAYRGYSVINQLMRSQL